EQRLAVLGDDEAGRAPVPRLPRREHLRRLVERSSLLVRAACEVVVLLGPRNEPREGLRAVRRERELFEEGGRITLRGESRAPSEQTRNRTRKRTSRESQHDPGSQASAHDGRGRRAQ